MVSDAEEGELSLGRFQFGPVPLWDSVPTILLPTPRVLQFWVETLRKRYF